MATFSRSSRLFAAYDGKNSSGNYGGFGPAFCEPTLLRVYMFFPKRRTRRNPMAGRPMMMLHVAACKKQTTRRKR